MGPEIVKVFGEDFLAQQAGVHLLVVLYGVPADKDVEPFGELVVLGHVGQDVAFKVEQVSLDAGANQTLELFVFVLGPPDDRLLGECVDLVGQVDLLADVAGRGHEAGRPGVIRSRRKLLLLFHKHS